MTFNLLQPSGFDVLTSPGFPRGGALLGLAACLATGLRLGAAPVLPAAAYYNEGFGGFYLHYDDLRASADPEKTLLDFCHSTYDAAAKFANWDKELLHARNL